MKEIGVSFLTRGTLGIDDYSHARPTPGERGLCNDTYNLGILDNVILLGNGCQDKQYSENMNLPWRLAEQGHSIWYLFCIYIH